MKSFVLSYIFEPLDILNNIQTEQLFLIQHRSWSNSAELVFWQYLNTSFEKFMNRILDISLTKDNSQGP